MSQAIGYFVGNDGDRDLEANDPVEMAAAMCPQNPMSEEP